MTLLRQQQQKRQLLSIQYKVRGGWEREREREREREGGKRGTRVGKEMGSTTLEVGSEKWRFSSTFEKCLQDMLWTREEHYCVALGETSQTIPSLIMAHLLILLLSLWHYCLLQVRLSVGRLEESKDRAGRNRTGIHQARWVLGLPVTSKIVSLMNRRKISSF